MRFRHWYYDRLNRHLPFRQVVADPGNVRYGDRVHSLRTREIVATDDSHMRGTRLFCSHNQNDSRLIARIVSARSFMQPKLSGNSTKTSGDEVPCKAASRADAWPGNHATIGRSAFRKAVTTVMFLIRCRKQPIFRNGDSVPSTGRVGNLRQP